LISWPDPIPRGAQQEQQLGAGQHRLGDLLGRRAIEARFDQQEKLHRISVGGYGHASLGLRIGSCAADP
jgi:hypothetical protein